MTTRMTTTMLLIIVALCIGAPLLAQDAPKPDASKPTVASEVRIWIDNPPEQRAIERALLKVVSEPRPREILGGIDEATARKLIEFRPDEDYATEAGGGLFGGSGGGGEKVPSSDHFVLRVELEKANQDLPKKASEFIDALVMEMQNELRQAWEREPTVARTKRAEREAEERLTETRDRMLQLRQAISGATGRLVDGSAADTRAAWARLDTERQSLEMERVGKQARQEALMRAMKEVSEDLSRRAAKDPVAEELEVVVKVRQDGYARLKELFKNASASQADVSEAEARLAEARAKVLERRDIVLERNGGTILVDLNRELQSVIITRAEVEAKLAILQESLKKFDKVRHELDTLQQLESERESLSKAAATARDEQADVLRSHPRPQIVVKLKHTESPPEK